MISMPMPMNEFSPIRPLYMVRVIMYLVPRPCASFHPFFTFFFASYLSLQVVGQRFSVFPVACYHGGKGVGWAGITLYPMDVSIYIIFFYSRFSGVVPLRLGTIYFVDRM